MKHEIFEHELLNPLRGHELTEVEEYVASLLLDASAERPMDNAHIRHNLMLRFHKNFSERQVKRVIRSLRKDHAFPIISRRERRPYGYWWCESKAQMEAYIKTFKGVALDELHTLSRITQANFPELAGQLRLDL